MKPILLALSLAAIPTLAQAQIVSRWQSNAALEKLDDGEAAEAQALMDKALEGDAANPKILYNWASTNLHHVLAEVTEAAKKNEKKGGKIKLSDEQKNKILAAQQEFEKLLKPDASRGGVSAKELQFQNAIAFELLENNEAALKNYYQSLTDDSPGLGDAKRRELSQKTQINIARLLVKSDSPSSGSGEGEGGGGGGQGQDKGQGEGQGESQGQPSQGPGSPSQEPQFSGTDVNESQAQQILNSVSNQDRQVQQRKGQQQSKQNMQSGEEGEVSPRNASKPW